MSTNYSDDNERDDCADDDDDNNDDDDSADDICEHDNHAHDEQWSWHDTEMNTMMIMMMKIIIWRWR